MRNIKLLLSYDGSRYAGWQRQKNAPTIQQTIEEKLAAMTGSRVVLHGAGRTDAGVHALGMVANFHTASRLPVTAFFGGLNHLLPPDIRILEASEVAADFHSRYGALGKTYCYHLFTGTVLPPVRRHYCAHIRTLFDIEPVRICLETILGTHDFSSFETAGSRDRGREGGRGGVRTIYRATCRQTLEDAWLFSFTGDGFLRHMVRCLVGTLVKVGGGNISPEEFTAILAAGDRSRAAFTAPACGLFLERVYYDHRPSPVGR